MSSEAIQLRPVGLIPPSSAGNCYSELLLFDLADFYINEAICCGVEAYQALTFTSVHFSPLNFLLL